MEQGRKKFDVVMLIHLLLPKAGKQFKKQWQV
jgi:hypothetical protein